MGDRDDAPANEWDAADYDADTGFVADHGASVVDLLDPKRGARVLDLGCGTGHLTAEIADRVGPEGAVLGVDSAPDMVRAARESYPDLAFECADARGFDPGGAAGPDAFDAVFSNAALHWVPATDQAALAERIGDWLVPGGRFVAELGGTGNVEAIVAAVQAELRERGYDREHPWYFPTVGEYAAVLESAGFEVHLARLFDRPTDLDGPERLGDWLDAFGDPLFAPLSGGERDEVVAGVEERLRADLYDPETGTWTADYRRLRVMAVRDGERDRSR